MESDDDLPIADETPPPPLSNRRYDIELPRRNIPGEPEHYRLPTRQSTRKQSLTLSEPIVSKTSPLLPYLNYKTSILIVSQ